MKFQTIILQKKKDNKMQEKPILFQTEMVRAILSGQKTQTRRVVKSPVKDREIVFLPDHEIHSGKSWYGDNPDKNDPSNWGIENYIEFDPLPLSEFECPYGQVGDEFWVRETFALLHTSTSYKYPLEFEIVECEKILKEFDGYYKPYYRADAFLNDCAEDRGFKWKPSIFMPRWASRIQLKITNVRVERLNDISEDDAYAEGVEWDDGGDMPDGRDSGGGFLDYQNEERWDLSAHESFKSLWQKINGKKIPWDENPWVWVIEFEVVKP